MIIPVLGLMAAVAVHGPSHGASRTAPAPVVLEMTCHELMEGAPSTETQTYRLEGDRLWRDGVLISTSAPLLLNHPLAGNGFVSTFASHQITGHKLVRRVVWSRKGGPERVRMKEAYDFDRQTILQDGRDTCRHDGR